LSSTDPADTAPDPTVLAPLAEETVGQFVDLLVGRRTVNLFQPMPAPEDELLAAIDAARWAPNHRLTQPWRFRLLGQQTRDAVIAVDVALATAKNGEDAGRRRRERLAAIPGWFVVTSARADDALVDNENYGATCCAVQNLSLYLWARGIGLKWTTGAVTRDDRFFAALGADPAAEQVVGLFWYGYPAMVPTQKRAATDDIVDRLP
jgi:nitroreductase